MTKNVPPKKTGKAGIKPLEVDADFETPVRKEKDPAKQLEELDKPTPKKGPLFADNPPRPGVANGRFKAFYNGPVISMKGKDQLVAMKFSTPLEDEHQKILPKIIAEAYHDMKNGRVAMKLNNIPAQHVLLFNEGDSQEEALAMPVCKVIHANVSQIQRKGEGTARNVIRLSFQLQTTCSKNLVTFSWMNQQVEFWLELKPSQELLWDEEGEDEEE